MDKPQQQVQSLVWDCGSSLYDSFELKSFERQLDSAIVASRTLSMPHLSSHADHDHPRRLQPLPQANKSSSSSSSKFSRSLQKFIRLVFRSKPVAGSLSRMEEGRSSSQHDGFFGLYERSEPASRGLSTIPEVPEVGFDSLPRRAASQRFTPSTPVGISCA